MDRTVDQLEDLIAAQKQEIDALLETTGKMSISYLAMRLNRVEDLARTTAIESRDRIQKLEDRIDAASKQFKELQKRVERKAD